MRRAALAPALLALLAGACGDRAAATPAPAPPRPPNVLLIVIDTLRGDRCGFAGYERDTTPRLAEFARDAVAFRNAWSPTCWTPPAHATLFTGLRPERHGTMTGSRAHLPALYRTLAEELGERGYATASFVNNPLLASEPSLFQGFETAELSYELDEIDPATQRTADIAVAAMLAAVRVQRDAGRPFFVFANLFEPHMPYTPPERTAARFVASRGAEDVAAARAVRFAEVARHTFGGERIRDDVVAAMSDLYDAEIVGVDADVGVLLDGLRDLGVLDDTLVVITSDHGEGFDEHGRLDHLQHLHAELLHIPLIVRYPGRFDGGRVQDEIVRLEDVTATIYDVCDIPQPRPFDGVSLADDLSGRVARAAIGDNDLMVGVAERYVPEIVDPVFPAERSVRAGRYHLIVRREGPPRLFDYESDPLEQNDLAAELPDVVEALEALVVW